MVLVFSFFHVWCFIRTSPPPLQSAISADADTACPEELSLDPPEIIGEYGTEVLVNCSSSVDHDGMYWRVGNESSKIQEEEYFIGHSVLLSDWNVTAECKMKLNESYECSKELEITIYKKPEVISLIQSVHATPKETQYELKCDFINVAPVQNLTVKWYKNDELIDTNVFNDTTKTPVNKSSVLPVTVSRGKGAQIRCEAQLNFVPHGLQPPVIYQTLNVSAHYPPELIPNKDIDFIVASQNEDITLKCEAEGNPPPVFQWTYDGMTMLESSNALSVTRVNSSASYTCTASNYLGNTTKRFYVRVIQREAAPTVPPTAEAAAPEDADTACPEELSLDPPEIIGEYGTEVLVNCSSYVDHDGMYWRVRNESFKIEEEEYFIEQSVLLSDWNVTAECKMKLNESHECSKELEITIYKKPEVISSIQSVHATPKETQYELKCDIINVAPVQNLTVKWYKNDELINTNVFNDTTKTPVNKSSVLPVTVSRGKGAQIRCEAQLNLVPYGLQPPVVSETLDVSAQYKPFIKACPRSYTAVEDKFSMDMLPCSAEGNPPPTIQWYHQGELINSSEPLTRFDTGKYTAEAGNSLGSISTSVEITVEYEPFFDCMNHYEIEMNVGFQTECEPEGNPAPNLTWFKDGKLLDSPLHWTKHDSGNYSLKATNKHGTAEHTIHLDVLYAPQISEGNSTKEMSLDENVTLVCSAEGNPAPSIHWNFSSAANLKETTVGRLKIITITRATSTNAGVYICVATNKVGTETRSVTLVMKGSSATPMAVIWGVLIVLIILIIVFAIVFLHNRQKRHREYSFVLANTKDGSNVLMDTMSEGVKA